MFVSAVELGSGQNEVRRGLTTVTVAFQIKLYCLTVIKLADASALQSGHVDENVLRAMLGRDEAEAFSCVKPFHGAFSHRDISFFSATRRIAMTWLSVVRVATEAERRQKIE